MTINKNIDLPNKPDAKFIASDAGIDSSMFVKGFKDKSDWVPEIDKSYVFDKETTLSILAGFEHNRRVMIQGFTELVNQHTLNKLLQIELAMRVLILIVT